MRAAELFEQCAADVRELNAIMSAEWEWEGPRPSGGGRPSGIGDPTAAQAIANSQRMADLETRREELQGSIAFCGELVDGLRLLMGAEYADVLELLYIDLRTWDYIADYYGRVHGCGRRRIYDYRRAAFDMVDGLGIAHIRMASGIAT